MRVTSTPFKGLLEISPTVFPDHRGWFVEGYRHSTFDRILPGIQFVQENLSFSKKGVLRGLHMQLPPSAQAKLVGVISGKVLDVAIDLRKGSRHFGKAYTKTLSDKEQNMLFLPEGFAHGFLALEDTLLRYRCSCEYDPDREAGVRWDDPDLRIEWGLRRPVLSEKDKKLPTLKELIEQGVCSPH